MPSIDTAAENCVRRDATDPHLVARELKNQGWLPATPNDQPPRRRCTPGDQTKLDYTQT
ncbi:hypothetical protein ACVWZ7_000523 [Arthrobacter sp. TE12232]